MTSPEILCTLGPSSLDAKTIRRLEKSGATLFRINLSHTRLDEVATIVGTIRGETDVPICLDTEGAQIRTGSFVERAITLRDNTVVHAHLGPVAGDALNLTFHPREIIRALQPGDFVSIDFTSVLVQVVSVGEESVSMRVLHGGLIGQNKAVTVHREIPLPPLTVKDRAAIRLGVELGLRHFALSFAGSAADVDLLRSLAGDDAYVISKIESLQGLEHLEAIAERSDALLIDRGDLSRQVPIELLPQTQKHILRRAKRAGVKVFVATNLLESMVSSPTPTRAEVNDIFTTLVDGADGLVLAAETAIGSHPVRCVTMVNTMIRSFQRSEQDAADDDAWRPYDGISLLVEPHGGRLVRREAALADIAQLGTLPRIAVSDRVLMDCEQIAIGTYSPLTGFMDRETVATVLETHRLPSGDAWPLPIVLLLGDEDAARLPVPGRVVLTDSGGGARALLDVGDVAPFDVRELALGMFGTLSAEHPGVAQLLAEDATKLVAGAVTLVEPLPSSYRHYLLGPAQTRFLFTQLGWSQVLGFHSRNPAHRVHEWIQEEALEQTGADGLYISPVLGPKKPGDFREEVVLRSYETLLEFGFYPKGKVVLGGFLTYPRYAGPREAVFTALCRKNMGCSHFIVGRDHAGVGQFYAPDAARELFAELGNIGVEPVFFDAVGYDPTAGTYSVDRDQSLLSISGTEVRNRLRAQAEIPEWVMRDVVREVLAAEIRKGTPVFYE